MGEESCQCIRKGDTRMLQFCVKWAQSEGWGEGIWYEDFNIIHVEEGTYVYVQCMCYVHLS